MNTMDYNFTYEFDSDDSETTIANSEPSIIIKEISETELPADGKIKNFFRHDQILTLIHFMSLIM